MNERKKIDGSEFSRETHRRAAINARVFRVLTKHRDDSLALHQVCHWAYFPSVSAQSEFSEAVRRSGYSVLHTEPYPYADAKPFGVEFFRRESIRPAILNAVCTELSLLAERLGGEYDGWETQVI